MAGILLLVFLPILSNFPALCIAVSDVEVINGEEICDFHATPLDLIFLLDSSGSLEHRFYDEVDVIRRIVKYVHVSPDDARVMLIQFSGTQHLEFNMSTYHDREGILDALQHLRYGSGITRIGAAVEFTLTQLHAENGLRGQNVPKVLFILSDGRTHDYPHDIEQFAILRNRVPDITVYAYGTGDYVATPALLNYTLDEKKIITNQNLPNLEPLFNSFKGVKTCRKVPVCVKGSDHPIDLIIVIDSSDSMSNQFEQQKTFVKERILTPINVHPEAARVALITYSGHVTVHFSFNSAKYQTKSAIFELLDELQQMRGTTATDLALAAAKEIFERNNTTGNDKVLIILTDGHSRHTPGAVAEHMRHEKITIIAISLSPLTHTNIDELQFLAEEQRNVLTLTNLESFEPLFLPHVGTGCKRRNATLQQVG